MDLELSKADAEGMDNIAINLAKIKEQTNQMKTMMKNILAMRSQPESQIVDLLTLSEPSPLASILVATDLVPENISVFVEDCHNVVDENLSSEEPHTISASSKPNLISEDGLKIIFVVDSEVKNEICLPLDISDFVFSDNKDDEVDSEMDSLVCGLMDRKQFCTPPVRQNAHEMIIYLSTGKPPPLLPEGTINPLVCHSQSTAREIIDGTIFKGKQLNTEPKLLDELVELVHSCSTPQLLCFGERIYVYSHHTKKSRTLVVCLMDEHLAATSDFNGIVKFCVVFDVPEYEVDAIWKSLTHTLLGLFCASINFLESGTRDKLSLDKRKHIQRLLKVNMEKPYGDEWPDEVLQMRTDDLELWNVAGLAAKKTYRVNTLHNVLISMQKKCRALVANRDGRLKFEPFPSLVITAKADGINAKGAYVEAQARSLHPDEKRVDELVCVLKEKKIGGVAHFYMDPEVQGVLTAAHKHWPLHNYIFSALVMADATVKMADAGCEFIIVLAMDFMFDNACAILDKTSFEKVGVYRMSNDHINSLLADAVAAPDYLHIVSGFGYSIAKEVIIQSTNNYVPEEFKAEKSYEIVYYMDELTKMFSTQQSMT